MVVALSLAVGLVFGDLSIRGWVVHPCYGSIAFQT